MPRMYDLLAITFEDVTEMKFGTQRASCVNNIWKNRLFSFLLLLQISKRYFTFLVSPLFFQDISYKKLIRPSSFLTAYQCPGRKLLIVIHKNFVRFACVFPCIYMASNCKSKEPVSTFKHSNVILPSMCQSN